MAGDGVRVPQCAGNMSPLALCGGSECTACIYGWLLVVYGWLTKGKEKGRAKGGAKFGGLRVKSLRSELGLTGGHWFAVRPVFRVRPVLGINRYWVRPVLG